MSQYTTGTISVTISTNTVTGVGTSWLTNVTAGDFIKADADSDFTWYEITSVLSDTSLTISPNYHRTVSGEAYTIVRDFTPNIDLPLLNPTDTQGAYIYSRAMAILDSEAQFGFVWKGVVQYASNTVPGSPVSGYAYLVGDNPVSGAWYGYDNQIAYYDATSGSGWTFYDPSERDYIWSVADGAFFVFVDDDWSLFSLRGMLMFITTVIDMDDYAAPTTGLTNGDSYVVASPVASGDAWYGKEDYIAIWNAANNQWDFYSPTTGDFVLAADEDKLYLWDGVDWQFLYPAQTGGSGSISVLNDLTDVNAPSPSDGHVLTWDSGTSKWVNQAPAASSSALSGLTDVNASAPTDQDVLTWNAGTGKWVSQAVSGASHNRQHALDSTADHTSSVTTGNAYAADANGLPADSGNSASDIHKKLHSLNATDSHQGSITQYNLVMGDANGLIEDAGVAASDVHPKQHAIDSGTDHTGSASVGNVLEADSNGLPADSGSSASLLHTKNHDVNSAANHGGVPAAVEDNYVQFNGDGLFKDSGDSASTLKEFPKIGPHTAESIQNTHRYLDSAGHVSGGGISAADHDTVNVGAGIGLVRSGTSPNDPLYWIRWAASSIDVASGTSKYIGVEYNAGSPQIVSKASDVWDYQRDFPLGIASNDGYGIHIETNPQKVGDLAANVLRRLYETAPIERDARTGGLIISETGTRNVAVTAGALWDRVNRFAIGAVDTSGADTMEAYYHVSGAWVEADISQWPNEQYDDGTDLVTMTNNRYGNLWFYMDTEGDLFMLYGTDEYITVAGAEAAQPPSSVPDHFPAHALLIGRFVFQKSAVSAESVESAFDTVFAGAAITNHDDLAGITTDNHHAQLHAVDSHSDVSAGSPNDGEVLTWNDSSSKWVAQAASGAAHDRLHALNSTADHSMTAVEDNIFTADANGLPKDGGTPISALAAVSGQAEIHPEQVKFSPPTEVGNAHGIVTEDAAGEAMPFGSLARLASDGKFYKSDADWVSTMPVAAMAAASAATNETIKWLRKGYAKGAGWSLTVGKTLYGSTTPGAFADSSDRPSGSGDVVQKIGRAEGSDVVWFDPDKTLLKLT